MITTVIKDWKLLMIQNIKNFDLEQIADSGQCFRWRKIDEDKYLIPAYDHIVTVAQ